MAGFRMTLLESPVYLFQISDKNVFSVLEQIALMNGNEKYCAQFALYNDPKSVIIDQEGSIFVPPFLKSTILQTIVYFASQLSLYNLVYLMPGVAETDSITFPYILITVQQIGTVYSVGIIGVFFAGYCLTKGLSIVHLQILSFLLAAIFSFLMVYSYSQLLIILVSSVLYIAVNSGNALLFTYTQEVYPPMLRGSGGGWTAGLCNITGILAPIVVSEFLAYADQSSLLFFISACYGVSVLFACLFR
jgi:MFS family permease